MTPNGIKTRTEIKRPKENVLKRRNVAERENGSCNFSILPFVIYQRKRLIFENKIRTARTGKKMKLLMN